jgi:hypothetical protein
MSPFWQWFTLILSVVALLMAAPTFLQLLFGQPKIGLRFANDDSGNEGRLIRVYLMNLPIRSQLLKALRVSRMTAQVVCLDIQVRNALTKQVIVDSFPATIALSPYSKDCRISLASSPLMVSVDLAKWQRSTNSAVLIRGDRLTPLQQGEYIINIQFVLDDKIKKCKPALLHIGKGETEMVWDRKITDKLLM